MLYSLDEFPDVYADACLRDSQGTLMFLSVYGRDGVLMQMLSALELGVSGGGVSHIHLVNQEGDRHLASVGDAKRLAKHAARLPRQNLFGQLNQVWIYDKALQTLDRANRIGYVMSRQAADANAAADDVWQLIKTLSPVALQEHWRDELIAWCRDRDALQMVGDSHLYQPLGAICAWRVSLTDHFVSHISQAVREQRLTLSA